MNVDDETLAWKRAAGAQVVIAARVLPPVRGEDANERQDARGDAWCFAMNVEMRDKGGYF
ncbi:MAG TPA: hypothetical protein VNM90_06325 [Haliangium sp.]|nr:hypothetical protein [Haliangium sp.]